MDLETTRKWKQWDMAVDKIRDKTYELSGDTCTGEEIEVALEDLESWIKTLKKVWNKNFKESGK